jgi:tetratricopeptide (TPR) repeat protein
MAYLFFFVSLSVQAQSSKALWEFEVAHLETYLQILHLEKSPTQLASVAKNDYAAQFLANLHEAIFVMITEDNTRWKSFKESCEQRLKAIGQEKDRTPYRRFYEAEMRLHLAFVQLKFGEEFKAGWNVRQAYRLTQANSMEYPDFLLHAKTSSLLQILLGSVPEKYTWLLSLLGMEGSIELGMDQLKKLRKESAVFRLEATLLEALVEAFMLQNTPQAVHTLEQVLPTYPHHPLVQYIGAAIYSKNHQADQVLTTLSRYAHDENRIPFHFIRYMQGEAFLQKGQYLEANKAYRQFLQHYGGQNFVKDAHYKIFLTYWLGSQPEKATKWWGLALEKGQEITEPDKHAAKILKGDVFPDKTLMRIRLATDGGDWDEALKWAENVPAEKLRQPAFETEWLYRKARIYHLMGQLEKAYGYYKLTIDHQERAQGNWYFAPNAALQLGYICVAEAHHEKARRYFEKALSYKNHEYKNSIDNKAKAALKNLK